MKQKDIERQAHELITTRIEAKEIVEMTWAVHELIGKQGTITGEGTEFFQLCAYENVYRIVKKIVERYESGEQEGDDRQLPLEGYDCLRIAYTVEMDGERKLVPITLIPAEVLLSRALEFERQSETLRKHAEELRIYVAKRGTKGGAAA